MSSAIRIGIIGDYDRTRESHLATNEALKHAAERLSVTADSIWLPTDSLVDKTHLKELKSFGAFFCAPGGPFKSTHGALNAIRYAREHDRPFLGT